MFKVEYLDTPNVRCQNSGVSLVNIMVSNYFFTPHLPLIFILVLLCPLLVGLLRFKLPPRLILNEIHIYLQIFTHHHLFLLCHSNLFFFGWKQFLGLFLCFLPR